MYLFWDVGSLTGSVDAGTADVIITGDGPEYFGLTLRAGDLDADGLDDLVVGAPDTYSASYASYYADDPGQIYIFAGSDLDSTTTTASDASSTITAGDSSTAFGMSIALGDLSGDSVPDLLVAAPAFGGSGGRVWIFETP